MAKAKKQSNRIQRSRPLPVKEEGQEYGKAEKNLGDCRFLLYCYDGKERIGKVRGKLRKRVYVNVGDFVLLGTRDYQDDKVDIIDKYSPDEVNKLRKIGELVEPEREDVPKETFVFDNDPDAGSDVGIDFDEI